MKTKKIAVMTDLLLIGGVQKAAIEQVRELNKLGHDAILLIQMRRKYSNNFSYLLKGIPYKYISDSYPKFLRYSKPLPIFTFLSFLHLLSPVLTLGSIKKGDYDLIVGWGTTTCLTTYFLKKFKNIQYLAIIHDPAAYILDKAYSKTPLRFVFYILKPIVKLIEGAIINSAKRAIVISNVHYKYIYKIYNVKPAIVPLGVVLPKTYSKTRGNNLLTSARWQKAKNPQFVLRLAKSLPKQKFIVAGSWVKSEELSWFKSEIKSANLQNQIKLISHYTDSQFVKLCSHARLWFHPHFEAFGLAALEAASFGLPIIFPKGSGVTEKFTHRVNGFFPKKVTVEEYKKYVEILLSDKKMAEIMGQKAREIVKKDFSWKSRVGDLMKYA